MLLAYFASMSLSLGTERYRVGTVDDGAAVEMEGNAGTRREGGHGMMTDGKGVSTLGEGVLT
jgi:hypothetical protein